LLLLVASCCRARLWGHFSGKLSGDFLGIHDFDFKQTLYGLLEVDFFFEHDDVNGVEVSLTVKASCEVCIWIGCGVKAFAQGTEESEVSVCRFMGQFEDIGNEHGDGNKVSEPPQALFGELLLHGSFL
jgi:hypothetical protein